jgi:hypothetical protein
VVQIPARTTLAPARPASLGQPPPGAVMGDPLSMPEADITPYPAYDGDPGPDPEPLWLKLPADLAPWFDLGFCHTDTICPYVVLRVRDEDQLTPVEVAGPPEAFLALAGVIVALCKNVPCLTHDARGEAAHRDIA